MNKPQKYDYECICQDKIHNDLPCLTQCQIEALVSKYIERRDLYLQAIQEYGSPLYIIEKDVLTQKARRFEDAFTYSLGKKPKIFYAIKSNNCPEVARIFLDCSLGLDVSSGIELQMALSLDAGNILFSGPGKTSDELAMAVQHSGRVTLLIDSFGELERLAKCLPADGPTLKAGVRLTVDPNGMWRKFGIVPAQLADFFERASQITGLSLEGIHFHTSWNLDPQRQVNFIIKLGEIIKGLPEEERKKLKFLDIGGGYWPEQGEWLQAAGTNAGVLQNLLIPESADRFSRYYQPGTPIEDYARAIADALKSSLWFLEDLDIYMEPGRWLVHEGMHIAMKVIDYKHGDLVITDAGTNAVGWERFETDFFPVINLSAPALAEIPCEVQGCLCTPRDLWGYSLWAESVSLDDVLIVPCQGAYTYSLKQKFIKSLPNYVIV